MATVTKGDNHKPTLKEAREVLAQSQQEQVEACRQEIDAVLEKHNCRLDASILVTAHTQIAGISG